MKFYIWKLHFINAVYIAVMTCFIFLHCNGLSIHFVICVRTSMAIQISKVRRQYHQQTLKTYPARHTQVHAVPICVTYK